MVSHLLTRMLFKNTVARRRFWSRPFLTPITLLSKAGRSNTQPPFEENNVFFYYSYYSIFKVLLQPYLPARTRSKAIGSTAKGFSVNTNQSFDRIPESKNLAQRLLRCFLNERPASSFLLNRHPTVHLLRSSDFKFHSQNLKIFKPRANTIRLDLLIATNPPNLTFRLNEKRPSLKPQFPEGP
jgi:hypothetical protein